MTRLETKIQWKEVEEIVNTEFLYGNTSSPTEVKKPRPTFVGFLSASQFGLNTLQCNPHRYNL